MVVFLAVALCLTPPDNPLLFINMVIFFINLFINYGCFSGCRTPQDSPLGSNIPQDTWQTQAGEPLVSRHQTSSQQVATPHTNILTGDHRHHRMRRHGGG